MATIPELDPSQVAELGARLRENVSRAVKAPEQVLRDVLVAFLAEGHVLIEDYPGVGKTALARALARSIDAEYARVQCTADLLPADVVGTNVYNQRENRFEFRPGPVFANVVLVDEVNRASPKTQSGLLECMQERHVTVDKQTHELARPFLVIATQNPVEYEGTYPLPEAQLDRFTVRVSLGYPTADQESQMLADHAERDRVLDLESVADVSEVLAAQMAAGGGSRQRGAAPLRGRDLRGDSRRSPGRARRLSARRPDALSRRQGERRARCPRPRSARRRPGARRVGPQPSSAAGARSGHRRARGSGARHAGAGTGALSMLRPIATASLGVALCLAAATFDSASFYVPGVALVAIAVLATGWVVLAATGAAIERRPGPHTVTEEEPYPLRIEVRSGALPPPGGELIEPLLGWPVPIAGRWSRRVRINVRFARRGRRVLEPGRLVIRDPLRLYSRELVGEGRHEVLVLPRVEPVLAPGGGGAGAGEHGGSGIDPGVLGRRLDASAAELEIDGLRPYREGAPASRIHWPSVARTGEMLERRLVAELDSAPLVVVDPSAPSGEENLDKAIRAAASICVHLAQVGGCAVLLPGDRRPIEIGHDMGAWPAVHVRLALVEAGAPPPTSTLGPRGGAVIWVTGADLNSAPRALERLPAGARIVVSPSALPGVRALFCVAECTGSLVERARRAAPLGAGRAA